MHFTAAREPNLNCAASYLERFSYFGESSHLLPGSADLLSDKGASNSNRMRASATMWSTICRTDNSRV